MDKKPANIGQEEKIKCFTDTMYILMNLVRGKYYPEKSNAALAQGIKMKKIYEAYCDEVEEQGLWSATLLFQSRMTDHSVWVMGVSKSKYPYNILPWPINEN